MLARQGGKKHGTSSQYQAVTISLLRLLILVLAIESGIGHDWTMKTTAAEFFYSRGFQQVAEAETTSLVTTRGEPRMESSGGSWFTIFGCEYTYDRHGRENAESCLAQELGDWNRVH